MKRLFFRHVFSVMTLSVFCLVFLACNKSKDNSNNNSAVAGLMSFNLANDKAVKVSVSGNPLSTLPMNFESYTGGYLSVNPGTQLVQSFDYNSNVQLDSTTFGFDPQKYYSLFVTGTNGHYKNLLVRDNFDGLLTTQSYVRYVDAIPDSTNPIVTITSGANQIVNTAAAYPSLSNFIAAAPGDITISVNNGGTINKSRTINLQQQKAYTVLLAGIPGSTGNDSLQIRFIENGTITQQAKKSPGTGGSAETN